MGKDTESGWFHILQMWVNAINFQLMYSNRKKKNERPNKKKTLIRVTHDANEKKMMKVGGFISYEDDI